MRNASGSVMTPILYGGVINSFDMGPSRNGTNVLQGRFEPVKTSTALTGSFGFSTLAHVPNQEFANGGTQGNSTINVKYTILNNSVPSCSVITTDIAVTLPRYQAPLFKASAPTRARPC
ncbi:hypothetical protein PQR53_16280 [Paraburkholderia fungorum]|uniref:hypothetical protein n=1 Tax=Paraburkholderia fungorum TaxID=134537 RepID=UPI0038BAD0D6